MERALPLVVAPTPAEAAARAARHIAESLTQAIATRASATLALSGGASPALLFAELARQSLDWDSVHVFQVDERVAPRGDAARNLTAIELALCERGPLPRRQLHAMPVEERDLRRAAAAYERELALHAGQPARLDVVHLGLGGDGHMASLFPGDPALDIADRGVAAVGPHAGFRRLTLTLPVIDGARSIAWFVTGAAKAGLLAQLVAGAAIGPAARVSRAQALVFADNAAFPDERHDRQPE